MRLRQKRVAVATMYVRLWITTLARMVAGFLQQDSDAVGGQTTPLSTSSVEDWAARAWNTSTCPTRCLCTLNIGYNFQLKRTMTSSVSSVGDVMSNLPSDDELFSSVTGTSRAALSLLNTARLPSEVRLRTTSCSRVAYSDNEDVMSTLSASDPLSPDTESLHITGYRFPLTSSYFAQLSDLRELSLIDSRIHSLSDVIDSQTYEQLSYLNLSRNELLSLQNRSFVSSNHVRVLDLSANKIETVYSDAFYGLEVLFHLDMSGNRYSHVDPRWLCRLPKLETLLLRLNNIHALGDGAFRCATRLVVLDVSANRVKNIHATAFSGILNLRVLLLSDNDLVSSALSVQLSPAVALEELDLSGNDFESIATESFVNLSVTCIKLNRCAKLQVLLIIFGINRFENLKTSTFLYSFLARD